MLPGRYSALGSHGTDFGRTPSRWARSSDRARFFLGRGSPGRSARSPAGQRCWWAEKCPACDVHKTTSSNPSWAAIWFLRRHLRAGKVRCDWSRTSPRQGSGSYADTLSLSRRQYSFFLRSVARSTSAGGAKMQTSCGQHDASQPHNLVHSGRIVTTFVPAGLSRIFRHRGSCSRGALTSYQLESGP